jgi:hypothetical protein
MIAGLCFGIWRIRGLRKTDAAAKVAPHDQATNAN